MLDLFKCFALVTKISDNNVVLFAQGFESLTFDVLSKRMVICKLWQQIELPWVLNFIRCQILFHF